MKDYILIVDDIEINRLILREILLKDYDIDEAENGREAVEKLQAAQVLPKAVLLDIIMPEMDGMQALQIMKADPRLAKIPVLIISAADAEENESRGLKAGAADYIMKPFNPDVVKSRVDNHVSLMRYQHELEDMIEKKTAEATRTYEQTLEALAAVIEYRNLESGTHIRRTRELTKILVDHMLETPEFGPELKKENYNSMVKAVVLHDIGKIGVPDNVLLKPGRLTAEEFDVIKTHTTIGADVVDIIAENLADNDMYLKYSREICKSHHERWDGRGYPEGLAGESIPLSARILSVVDVYDALVNPRCYKAAYSHEDAIKIITEESDGQFDPRIIKHFLTVAGEFRDLEAVMADEI